MNQPARLGLYSLFVWCLAATAAWAQPTTNLQLAVWARRDAREGQATMQVVRAYQQRHANVRVNIRYAPDEIEENGYKVLRRWCGKYKIEAPDVVVVADQWLDEFTPSLMPLNKGIADSFLPSIRKLVTRGEKVLGVPWVVDDPALLCRSDLLAKSKLRPPTTWEEMQQRAPELGDKGKAWGFGLAADRDHGPQMLLQLLWAEGGEILDTNGRLRLDSPELVSALTRLVGIAHSGGCQPEVLAWSAPELLEAFAAGKIVAMLVDRQSERELARRKGVPKYTVVRLPRGRRDTTVTSLTCIAGMSTTQQSAAVADFLAFVASSDAQKILAEAADSVPVHGQVARSVTDASNSRPFIDALGEARSQPPVGEQYEAMLQAFDAAVCFSVKGRYSPEEALKAVADWYKGAYPVPEPPKPGPKVE